MYCIDDKQISNLNISSCQLLDWVSETIKNKRENILPPKTALHMDGGIFYTTMPCIMPKQHIAGAKFINRYPNSTPSLNSNIMLYDLGNGQLKAIMDGSLITTMRTAAVAVHSINLFARKDYKSIAFIGLGNVGKWTLKIYIETLENKEITIRLLDYKNRGQQIIDEYKQYPDIKWELYNDYESLINDCDVIVSAVTYQEEDFTSPEKYKKGVLIVPIHTRGFIECDLEFDAIFGDDKEHVCGFKYFNQYKRFDEVCDVVNGIVPGRKSNQERILVYNIGIALHDLFFANSIYTMIYGKIGM